MFMYVYFGELVYVQQTDTHKHCAYTHMCFCHMTLWFYVGLSARSACLYIYIYIYTHMLMHTHTRTHIHWQVVHTEGCRTGECRITRAYAYTHTHTYMGRSFTLRAAELGNAESRVLIYYHVKRSYIQ